MGWLKEMPSLSAGGQASMSTWATEDGQNWGSMKMRKQE